MLCSSRSKQLPSLPLLTPVATAAAAIGGTCAILILKPWQNRKMTRTWRFYLWMSWGLWCLKRSHYNKDLLVETKDDDCIDRSCGIHPMSQELCASAVCRLLPSRAKRWLFTLFFPFHRIPEKSVMMGYHLLYKLVRCSVIRCADPSDIRAFQPNDHLLMLIKLRDEIDISNDGLDVCGSTRTVQMNVGEDEPPLPVTYLPLSTAVLYEEDLPPFGSLLDKTVELGHSSPYIVPIFVSHRWYTADVPNVHRDWDRLLSVVIVAMQCCVQTSLLLLRSGFPLLDFLECLENNMSPLSNFPATCNIAALFVNGPDFVGTDGVLKCLPQISGSLSTSLFRLVAPIVVKDWYTYLTVCRTSAVDTMVSQWLLRAMDNVWLWYDFTSLPQKPFRYTCPKWKTHFDRSLGHLQMIQKRSHTFLLNSSVETYYARAWCYAEYVGVQNLQDGVSEIGHARIRGHHAHHQIALYTFELLLNPSASFSQVLDLARLQFTNDAHADKSVPAICWILWNNLLSNTWLYQRYFSINRHESREIFLGCAEASKMVRWLSMIYSTMQVRNELQPATEFASHIQQYHGGPGFNQDEWMQARRDAKFVAPGSDSTLRINVERINVIVSDNFAAAVLTAMGEAAKHLIGSCDKVAIFLYHQPNPQAPDPQANLELVWKLVGHNFFG